MNERDNPWHPTTDAVDLKYLGKLVEECGELSSATARCIIQGIDGREPDTAKLNCTWLTEEIADVRANIELVIEHFKLNRDEINARAFEKIRRLKIWHEQA